MKTIKNSILSLLCIVCIFFSVFAIMGFTTKVANASTSNIFTAEDYTSNDRLLKEDGSLSIKDITDFSDEVKSASDGDSFPELSQVIPKEYLDSEELMGEWAYNGAEYGFYVSKHGDEFDVLLIDFIYEFDDQDHSDMEFKIRIKPLLQQTFEKFTYTDGTVTWVKRADNSERYKYYVANPIFLTELKNENALNYGDAGYSKQTDDGLIIDQFRVNYGKVSYATEADWFETVGEFAGNLIFDVMCSATGVGGTVIGYMKDFVDFGVDLYQVGKETTILADNENNIKTQMSKENQKNNPEIPGYSRVAGFMPEEEIVLSDADDSYAEFIVKVNDSTYRSRLMQYFTFDIVGRKTDFQSMKYVIRAENEEDFGVYKERVIFDDAAPKYSFNSKWYETDYKAPIYLLPKGTQYITIKPEYTGAYSFSVPVGTQLILDDSAVKVSNMTYNLEGGKSYKATVINNSDTQTVVSQVSCNLNSYVGLGVNDLSINGSSANVYSLSISPSGYYIININNSNISICEGAELISEGVYYVQSTIGESRYIAFKNNSTGKVDCQITITVPQSIDTDTEMTLDKGVSVLQFENVVECSVKYNLTLYSGEPVVVSALVCTPEGELDCNYSILDGNYTCTFVVEGYSNCFIILNLKQSSNIKIEEDESQWRWVLDGEILNVARISLKRSESYNLYLAWVNLDGELEESINTYDFHPGNSNGAVYEKYVLTISPEAELGDEIFISPVIKGNALTIIVIKNNTVSLKLDYNGGTGTEYQVYVELGQTAAVVGAAPTRNGYTFNGYYTSRYNFDLNNSYSKFAYRYGNNIYYFTPSTAAGNKPTEIVGGTGTKYLDMYMKPAYDIGSMENGIILYACWVPNQYLITFQNSKFQNTGTMRAFYGCKMSKPVLPTKTGYLFDYYSGPDGDKFFGNGTLDYFTYTRNVSFTEHWKINSEAYVDFSIVKKANGIWTIKIINTVDAPITVEYNSRMCFFNDAKNWSGLNNKKSVTLDPYASTEVTISQNGFATSITASIVIGSKRYITYANNLSTSGTMSKYHNITNA